MPSNAQALPFTALTMSVGDLLANPFYIQAPPYQRSFSWGEQEAGKLLEDITSVPSPTPEATTASTSWAPCCSSSASGPSRPRA